MVYLLHYRVVHLVDDIRAFAVGTKFPDPFKQCPGLLPITFIQTDYLPGTVSHKWGLGRGKVHLGAEGSRWHGGVTGDCGRARWGRGRRTFWPLQERTTCSWVYAWMSCAAGNQGWRRTWRERKLDQLSLLCVLFPLNVLLLGSMGQSLRCPGWLTALWQDGQELLYSGRGVREVEPEGAAGYQHKGLQ